MTDQQENAEAQYVQADKLSRGKRGHVDQPRAGFLQHASGRWRSPELHAQILDLFTRASESPPLHADALYRRALEHLNVRHLDAAEADQRALEAMGSPKGMGMLPIQILLKRGNRPQAQRYLDALNAENRKKGLPKQTLADFEWFD